MTLPKYSFSEHLREMKHRVTVVLVWFLCAFSISYYYSQEIFQFLLEPLVRITGVEGHKIIYTGLTEAFFTYLSLSMFAGFILSIPIIVFEIYLFMRPGLYEQERKIAALILSGSPVLFIIGACFVFYLVVPRAWDFFISFEITHNTIPLVLEARISEYLSLVIKLIIAFGIAFQMPVVFIIFALCGWISSEDLKNKRRIAIVINFIIAGIFTPPDIISQISLAIPMLLLYEFSIFILIKISQMNRGK